MMCGHLTAQREPFYATRNYPAACEINSLGWIRKNQLPQTALSQVTNGLVKNHANGLNEGYGTGEAALNELNCSSSPLLLQKKNRWHIIP